ncbi:MAG: hypothetical protein QXV17_03840 [Candidatus Micrarchaeaceae archaeon]
MIQKKIVITLTVVVVLLLIYSAYSLISRQSTATSTVPSSLSSVTTVPPGNYLPSPPTVIGNYTLSRESPFSSIPSISEGYDKGVVFLYNSNSSYMVIRFLAYSNHTSALNAYRFITNYTVNSTTTLLAPLPANYSGVKVLQSNTTIYSVSMFYGANVITATVVQPSSSAYSSVHAISFLIYAIKSVINQPG